jgi:hypothetical protein
MVEIMAAIKRITKTANIESPPFYCQRPLLKLNSFHRKNTLYNPLMVKNHFRNRFPVPDLIGVYQTARKNQEETSLLGHSSIKKCLPQLIPFFHIPDEHLNTPSFKLKKNTKINVLHENSGVQPTLNTSEHP